MTDKARTTVIIPCYNAERTLEASVRSVLDQDGELARIILVDDRSTDGSFDLAERLAAEHEVISTVRQARNSGPAAARNRGLALADTPYVCFLDSDDAYNPAFLASALEILDALPHVASVTTGVELIDCPVEVDDVRLAAIVASLPGNIVVRRPVANLIGGFPDTPAFRGRGAGEDNIFRTMLVKCFQQVHVPERLFRYTVGEDSHLLLFLERSRVEGNTLIFTEKTEEEQDGSLDREVTAYLEAMTERVQAASTSILAVGNMTYQQLLSIGTAEVTGFLQSQDSLRELPGAFSVEEAYILGFLAGHGPTDGAVIEIGPLQGQSTGWLAVGSRRANRGPVTAVHINAWGDPSKGQGDLGQFRLSLQTAGIGDFVEVPPETPQALSSEWLNPIRLLVIGADRVDVEELSELVKVWTPHLKAGGLLVLYGVEHNAAITALHNQLASNTRGWRQTIAHQSLRVFEKLPGLISAD